MDGTILVVGATLAAALLGGLASTLGGYWAQRMLRSRELRTELLRGLVPDARGSAALIRWGRAAGSTGIPRLELTARKVSDVVTTASSASRRDARRVKLLSDVVDCLLRQDRQLEQAQDPSLFPENWIYTSELKSQTDTVLSHTIDSLDAYAIWLGHRVGGSAPPFDPHGDSKQ